MFPRVFFSCASFAFDRDFVSAVMISSVLVRIVPELADVWYRHTALMRTGRVLNIWNKRGQKKTTSCSGFPLSPYICSFVFSPCVAYGLPHKVKEVTCCSCRFPGGSTTKWWNLHLKFRASLDIFPSVQGTCGSSCALWAPFFAIDFELFLDAFCRSHATLMFRYLQPEVMHGLMWQCKSPCRPMSTWS